MLIADEKYIISKAGENDIKRIVEIFNSDPTFLMSHLNQDRVDEKWLSNEWEKMKNVSIHSAVITDRKSGEIVGYCDFQDQDIAYISLLIIDKIWQEQGKGYEIYQLLEKYFQSKGCGMVRVDVVYDYADNAVEFCESLGFKIKKEITIKWNDKISQAYVMTKRLPLAKP